MSEIRIIKVEPVMVIKYVKIRSFTSRGLLWDTEIFKALIFKPRDPERRMLGKRKDAP